MTTNETDRWDLVAVLERGTPPTAPTLPVRVGQLVKFAGQVHTVFDITTDEIGQPVLTLKRLGTGRKERVGLGTLAALAA